jgi:hypothetical protein
MRLKLESLEAMTTALEQLQLLMGATKPVSTGGTVSEQPDWQTRLKACRLVLAITFASSPSSKTSTARQRSIAAYYASTANAAPATKGTASALQNVSISLSRPSVRTLSQNQTARQPGRNRIQQM